VVGIGVAAPSPIDPAAPGRHRELIFPAWRSVDIAGAPARGPTTCPWFIDNDANLGALAERWWAQASRAATSRTSRSARASARATSSAASSIRGATGTAGESDHVPVDPNGPMCVCGNRGCLTTFHRLGGARRARRGSSSSSPSAPSLAEIVRSRARRRRAGFRLVEEVGERLGVSSSARCSILLNMDVVGDRRRDQHGR
jgi:predicted NBD/HSP70 family sugar kinase